MTKNEIFEYFGAKNEEGVKRYLYKYTNCGAWIEFQNDGFVIGSIVEGSDQGTDSFQFKYNELTDADELDKAIQEIENQAELIWIWANKIGEDGMTDAERGYDWPLL